MTILPAGQSCRELSASLEDLKSFALAEIDWPKVSCVVCGIEPGWDQAVALTAIDIGVDLHVVVPYYDWMRQWSPSQQKKCARIIDEAIIFESWVPEEHTDLEANRRLASLADEVMVLGREGYNSTRISVATHQQKVIRNLWKSWTVAMEVF